MVAIIQKKQTHYFEVNHFARLWSFWVFTGVQHRYLVLFDLLFQVTQFSFHLIAATHLADELALERIDVRIQLQQTTVVEHTKEPTHRRPSKLGQMVLTSLNWTKPSSPSSDTHAYAASLCKNNWHRAISSLRNNEPMIPAACRIAGGCRRMRYELPYEPVSPVPERIEKYTQFWGVADATRRAQDTTDGRNDGSDVKCMCSSDGSYPVPWENSCWTAAHTATKPKRINGDTGAARFITFSMIMTTTPQKEQYDKVSSCFTFV